MISGVMPCHLDVHLQRGDAVLGAGDLEIHVAQMVLVAQDVGQDREFAILFQHQAHGHPGPADFLSGTPASIIDSDDPQTVAIELDPFDSVISDQPDRVGEIGGRRQNRLQCPPRELAMADLAPSRRADAAGLAHAIGREVVVQQEVGAEVAVQRVDELLVIAGAQRGHHQSPASRRG